MVALVSTLSPVATVVIAKKLEKLLPVLLVPIFVIVEDSVVDVLISALVGVTLPAIKSGRPGVGVLKIVHNGTCSIRKDCTIRWICRSVYTRVVSIGSTIRWVCGTIYTCAIS